MSSTNRDIIRLAVPSILANITIPLVGLVDTAIVGHISDASSIGGIAIGTMLFDLLYWNFGFLRIGTSGLTAQAYGRGDADECRNLLHRSLSIALLGAVLVWIIQWFFVTAVLWCVPCSPEVAKVAREYFFIRIWAAPATLSIFTFKGWFIGMQDTRSPMTVDIVVNVVNMVASYLLAVTADLGVVGVAWGTLIAQYTGLLLACGIWFIKYPDYVQLRDVRRWRDIYSAEWSKYLNFNSHLFVRSLCFMVVYVGFTSLASQYDDTQLAVSSILMKLFMFFSFFVDGFAYAGEALVGKAVGNVQRDKVQCTKDEVNPIVRLLFNWSIGVGLVFTLIYAVWGYDCIGLLTSDEEVLQASHAYIGWLIAMPLISTLAFMWDGVYTGVTAGKEIRNAMIWAAISFVGVYVAGEGLRIALDLPIQALTILFAAYFAHLFARVIYLSVKYKRIINLNHI